MKEDIGIKTSWNIIEPFTDNSIPICARCGIRLNNNNISRWSDVIENNKTQSVCKNCLTKGEKEIDIKQGESK